MTDMRLPSEIHNLKFERTVQSWDEAVPLGNGQCGALIWGGSRHLRFSLDRGDIWDTTPDPGVLTEEFTYQNMVRLAREKEEEEIRRILRPAAPCGRPWEAAPSMKARLAAGSM